MNKTWIIIWVSNWCKAEGVQSGVYYNKSTAIEDADKLNLKDNTRKYHVVEYGGKEHEYAIVQSRSNPFK